MAGRAAPISSMKLRALAGLHTPSDPGRPVVGVGERVPHTPRREDERPGRPRLGLVAAPRHGQLAVEDVDRLVEPVVDVRGRPGETGRHRQLADGEALALAEHPDEVPGVGNRRSPAPRPPPWLRAFSRLSRPVVDGRGGARDAAAVAHPERSLRPRALRGDGPGRRPRPGQGAPAGHPLGRSPVPGRSPGTHVGPDAIFTFWRRMAEETGGGLRLAVRDVLANDARAVALVDVIGVRGDHDLHVRPRWSSSRSTDARCARPGSSTRTRRRTTRSGDWAGSSRLVPLAATRRSAVSGGPRLRSNQSSSRRPSSDGGRR